MSDPAGSVEAPPATRAERRRRSESMILAAARTLFAQRGYERTTIRGIAAWAGVDPALVMQHFASKEALFAAAAEWSTPAGPLVDASREDLPRAAVHHVLDAMADPQRRDAAVALLRSCLTHPSAQAILRDEVMGHTQSRVAGTIGGPDADLRAALLNACTLGLMLSRYVLEIPAVAEADPADLDRVLIPALQTLVGPG